MSDIFLFSVKSVTSILGFFHIVTVEVNDRKSMKFIGVTVDFFLVAITTKVSDRKSVKSLAVAVDSFHVVTVEMGD